MNRTTAQRLAASVRGARPAPPTPTSPAPAAEDPQPRRARRTAAPAVHAEPSAAVPVVAVDRTDGGVPPSSAGERFPRRVWPD
jgi:hypothetical protein